MAYRLFIFDYFRAGSDDRYVLRAQRSHRLCAWCLSVRTVDPRSAREVDSLLEGRRQRAAVGGRGADGLDQSDRRS